MHDDHASTISPTVAPVPTTIPPKPLANVIYAPFNKPNFAVSLSRDHEDVKRSGMVASDLSPLDRTQQVTRTFLSITFTGRLTIIHHRKFYYLRS